jgi:serine/threonine protein kinase
MRVTLFHCGPAANESELIAFKHLESRLQSASSDDEWILLTNLAFSVTQHLQSDEIDVVAIGPQGIRVIEIKHWAAQWVDAHMQDVVTQEAERVTEKARKVGTTLRRTVPTLPRVDGTILLTQEPAKVKRLVGKVIRGVKLLSLNEWKDAVGVDMPARLTPQQVRVLGRALEPKSAVAVDGSLRRFAGYVNLELQTPKEQRFHRIYRGVHSTRQDRVILHLYDLSVREEENAEAKARREYEALRRLQLHTWAPRILDSFQDAPGYAGEMFFFTLVDPAAPSIEERATDRTWETVARLAFGRSTIRAVRELHDVRQGHGIMVHRNLTSKTILVKHDNSPILTGFDRTKIPSDISVASPGSPVDGWDPATAPEVREKGLGSADCRSDVYSVCACLAHLFRGRDDNVSQRAVDKLNKGLAADPDTRATLDELDRSLSDLLGDSVPLPPPPPSRFWTEDQVVRFRDRDYRIVSRLGSGGVGTTFKVVEIDRSTKEDLGTYVAKVGHNEEVGRIVLRSYSLARSHLGRHPALSAIFEVSREWQDNDFIALLTWIEGAPLREFISVFPLLSEEQQEGSSEALALRWLRTICEALGVLHRNNLVHGDISPRNLIVCGADLVLTDYDFVSKIGEPVTRPATVLYCSPSYEEKRGASPADDMYALAASFFHVVFDKEPFQYEGILAKRRGLNWEGLDRAQWPTLSPFLDTATHPDPARRFSSVNDALNALRAPLALHVEPAPKPSDSIPRPPSDWQVNVQVPLRENEVEWLLSLLQSYPGSRWGNRETRGLDTDFAAETYVATNLEDTLYRDILARHVRLIVLCGNAGDGKTALLQHLAKRLGLGKHTSSERILEGQIDGGLIVRMNLDGSAAWQGRSADDLLDEFLGPFQQGPPSQDIVHLLAINDGRLLEWIARGPETSLGEELTSCLGSASGSEESYVRFIDLNHRSLVGSISTDRKGFETRFLDQLLDQLYGGEQAGAIWAPCQSCSAKDRCEVFRANQVFGPQTLTSTVSPEVRLRARRRLYEALQAVHLRGETHVTVRELRAALVYVLFGVHFCRNYHGESETQSLPYWDRAFLAVAPDRQGEVLKEIARFDPGLEAHPQIDRYLLSAPSNDGTKTAPHYENLTLDSARRRAFFEWTEGHIEEIAGERDALGLARGRNLQLFRDLALQDDASNKAGLCARLCRGISRLEDLPPQAFDRADRRGVVPLRITPRTPTETTFWVEKQISAFRLEADIPVTAQMDRLHRHALLIYRYRNGTDERLWMGAELFHLLLELSDGYQLGDISTDDTFANLSIFVQRLIREDERELLAWNPMKEHSLYKVAARIDESEEGVRQRMVLTPLAVEENA